MSGVIERAERWLEAHDSLTETYAVVWDCVAALKAAKEQPERLLRGSE